MISEEEHEQMPEPVRERLEALKDAPGSVIVVGSMNADYTVTTKRLPKPGETVNGGAMKVLPGGKGANQASAAARLGVNVQLLGAVGEDSNADFLLSKLDEAGVDTADILHVEGPSGTTVITVSAEGENTIVYSPGSNAKARPAMCNHIARPSPNARYWDCVWRARSPPLSPPRRPRMTLA